MRGKKCLKQMHAVSEICYDCFVFSLFSLQETTTQHQQYYLQPTTAQRQVETRHQFTTGLPHGSRQDFVSDLLIIHGPITKLLIDYHDEKALNETFGNLGRFLCLKLYFLVVAKRLTFLIELHTFESIS